MPPSPSTPSPERGAIKQCIAYCFGKMWANRGSNYLPERVDTAAESELAALEAENAVLRAKLAKRDEEPSANRIELASYALHLALKAASARLGAFSETRYLLESAVRAVVANLKNTQPLQQDAARVSADASKEDDRG